MLVTAFARRIKKLRNDRGMTVRDLASAIGKSIAYVGKIEGQGEIPSPQLTYNISRALDASPIELLELAMNARLFNNKQEIEAQYSTFLKAPKSENQVEIPDIIHEGKIKKMAKVVSLINMKGGVGKTTLAMQLAHSAAMKGFRTLAVDLDPQSNLSQAMMSPPNYVDHIENKKPTVVQIFDGYVPSDSKSGSPKLLDVSKLIVRGAGQQSRNLDLIPSRLELSRSLKNPTGKERRLAKALAQISDRYDLIIIDCAPTESVLTDAAYFASRYVIVPIKPEFMATIGLPLLARSLQEFKLENDDHKIDIAGLIFNHSSTYSSGPEGQTSIADVTKEASLNDWHIFENQVKYSASYAKSAREGTPINWTSYARSEVILSFGKFADEVFKVIGMSKVSA